MTGTPTSFYHKVPKIKVTMGENVKKWMRSDMKMTCHLHVWI